jgi:6-pyruvoyltetrahydropterin/6-carboxytetrahydropterin synthase
MYQVIKRMEFAASHYLDLPYESPCSRLHGHNYIVEVCVCGQGLNEQRMLVDFSQIKAVVNRLDHQNLGDIKGLGENNPTAEAIAVWIADEVQIICPVDVYVDYVSVQESEGNEAIWER